MNIHPTILTPLISTGLMLIGTVLLWLIKVGPRIDTLEKNLTGCQDAIKEVPVLRSEVRALQAFQGTLLNRMATLLISPHTPRADVLLRRLQSNEELSLEEYRELKRELDEEFQELHATIKGYDINSRQIALTVVLALLDRHITAMENRETVKEAFCK